MISLHRRRRRLSSNRKQRTLEPHPRLHCTRVRYTRGTARNATFGLLYFIFLSLWAHSLFTRLPPTIIIPAGYSHRFSSPSEPTITAATTFFLIIEIPLHNGFAAAATASAFIVLCIVVVNDRIQLPDNTTIVTTAAAVAMNAIVVVKTASAVTIAVITATAVK